MKLTKIQKDLIGFAIVTYLLNAFIAGSFYPSDISVPMKMLTVTVFIGYSIFIHIDND